MKTLENGLDRAELCWWYQSGSGDAKWVYFDHEEAARFLRQYYFDRFFIHELRMLLGDVEMGYVLTTLHDHQIFDEVARRLASGQLLLRRYAPRPADYAGIDPEAEIESITPVAPPPAAPPPRREPEREPPPPEEATFPPDTDAKRIAEAKKEAARLGLPFCEECLKAEIGSSRPVAPPPPTPTSPAPPPPTPPPSAPPAPANREAEREPPSQKADTFPPDTDASRIAEAKKEAARRGLPFCEECLKEELADERRAS